MPSGIYKRTPEMKKKLFVSGGTPWNKGKTGIYSKETLEKIGKNNPNYKGGITTGEKRKGYVDNYNRDYRRKMRSNTLDIMGGKCVMCGFNDYRALQIDHINGGGNKERNKKKFIGQQKNYHKMVIESFLKKENKYQLLCANCNWIKRCENKEVNGIKNKK